MGLFSGKTKIQVSSVAYNIAGDADGRSNFLKESLTYLTVSGQGTGEKLPRMYLQSLGVKLKRAYKHAASLPQGLPTASMQLWEYQDFEDAVQSMLDIEHGPNRYKVEDAYITQGNTAPVIETYLNRTYGWDSVSGLMANPPAGIVEDADVSWSYQPPQNRPGDSSPKVSRTYKIEFRNVDDSTDPDLVVDLSLDAVASFESALLVVMVSQWLTNTRSDQTVTRPFEPGDVDGEVVSPTLTTAGARITVSTTTVTTDTDGTTTSIRTRIVDESTSEAVSRKYVLGTGEWPSLDSLWISRANVEQTFFPSVPFRVENKDLMDEKLMKTDDYKATKKLCTLMGIDASFLSAQVNDNPSIKDIDFAFLVAGANMNTESQAEMDYLFRFWDLCRERQTAGESDLTTWRGIPMPSRGKPKTNSLVIEDPESKNGAYKVTIEWDFIKKEIITGVIGAVAKVGKHEMIRGATSTEEFGAGNSRQLVDNTVVSIRRQINETQYEQLSISGAVHKNDVYKGKVAETLAWEARAEPAENEGFIVPLHMGIFNTMPITKRTQLAQECLYMVFNCYVKTKQKWYQTSAFKIVLAIVLIVMVIMTWGSTSSAAVAAWGSVATSVSLTVGISVATAAMLLTALTSFLVSYLLGKWSAGFVSVFGEKWAGVVMGIISIVVSAYTGGGGFQDQGWLRNAVQIIDIASQLFTAYAKGVMVVAQKEFNSFMDQAEEDKKLLDKLSSEFFGENDLVSIDYLLELQKTLREDSPTVFMARTLMTGSDIVDITMGQISEMVPMNINPRLQGIYL